MNWAVELSKTKEPSEGQANLFGVIIYTNAHPHIKKVLRDEDYWQALDEVSGPQWSVYAVRAAEGTHGLPNLPPGYVGMMYPVWKEPKANKELLELFGLSSTENLPVIVVFAQNEDGDIYQNIVDVDDSTEEQAYKSIKEVLRVVAQALEKVSSENLQTDVNAFHAVSYSIKNYKEWRRIKKGASVLTKLGPLAKVFR